MYIEKENAGENMYSCRSENTWNECIARDLVCDTLTSAAIERRQQEKCTREERKAISYWKYPF
jgi:hypothetical protein